MHITYACNEVKFHCYLILYTMAKFNDIEKWTLSVLIFEREQKHIHTSDVISPHWHDTGSWNPSSSKTRTYLFYIVNIIGADVLATQGAWASATMIFTMLNRINSVPHSKVRAQTRLCPLAQIAQNIYNRAFIRMDVTESPLCGISIIKREYFIKNKYILLFTWHVFTETGFIRPDVKDHMTT